MEEDQSKGQLIVAYSVELEVEGHFVPFSNGYTVGKKRIDLVDVAMKNVTA